MPTSVEFFPVENDLTMIQHQASQDLIRQAMKITDLLMSVLQGEAVYSEEIKVMIKDLCDARPLMDNQMAEQAQAISLIHEILDAMPLPEHEKDTLVNMCVDLKGDLKTSLEQKKEKVA